MSAIENSAESRGNRTRRLLSPGVRRGMVRGIALVALVLLAASSIVFVDETEYVIVETLGRISAVYDNADAAGGDRGLHVKWPWPVGTVRRFDRRQQLFDPAGREMFTRDRKNLTVATYLCWKIADPEPGVALSDRPVVTFFQRLGAIPLAESRLETFVRSALATEIGRIELSDLLSVKDSEAGPAGESALGALAARTLAEIRGRAGAESLRDSLGIELVDLRIRRINLPEGNRLAVYERMRSERERIAERYRSDGLAEKARIESQARRQSDELLARAEADAERIRGAGEAEAIRILNQAHAQDPEFYEFQQTLATYAKILNDRTTLVLSSGSRLFRLLTEGVAEPTSSGMPAKGKPAAGDNAPREAAAAGAARNPQPGGAP